MSFMNSNTTANQDPQPKFQTQQPLQQSFTASFGSKSNVAPPPSFNPPEEEKKGSDQFQQVHAVKAKDQDKVLLSTIPLEDFLEYQHNRYLSQNNPLPKTVAEEYHQYAIKVIEDQSKMIFEQLSEAEDEVNTY